MGISHLGLLELILSKVNRINNVVPKSGMTSGYLKFMV